MGLLDSLEQEADKRRSGEADEAQRRAERGEIYRTQLEPAVDALHDYLQRFVAQLKVVRPRVALRHPIPGYGDVIAYLDHDYELRYIKQSHSREIKLISHATVASAECPSAVVRGSGKIKTVAALFQRHRLGGMLAPEKDAGGEVVAATFKAKGRIPLGLTASADATTAQLKLAFANYDDFATVGRSVAAAHADEALFEEIGRYLLREANSLLREDLPDNVRLHLKAKVQQQEIRRRWEARIETLQHEEVAMLRARYTLRGRIAEAFGRLRRWRRSGG